MSATHRSGTDLPIKTPLRGSLLLDDPVLNKDTAFSEAERISLGLLGLLPPHEESLEEQVARAFEAYERQENDLDRHLYLRGLQDRNETIFYRLVLDHLPAMMPMIYTPVVGAACQQFSEIYRRPRGLFISYPERHRINDVLANWSDRNVRVIVMTDGERILGLGDQGAGGMGIPIGKLSLYTACGGIDPANTLPILLDVGTNNQERLNDPRYIGWRHERITGQDYFDFLDEVVQGIKRHFPTVLLQFEDFAQTHASPLLATYRDQLCTFNDDIQGTAAVTVGTLLAAAKVTDTRIRDHRVAFLGAGSAGCGIAEQIIAAMVEEGLSEPDARAKIFMVDRPGLLHDAISGLLPFQENLCQSTSSIADWTRESSDTISLLDVVRNAKPSILIGVSGQPHLFSEDVIKTMAGAVDRPIVFPLSNPTSRIEAAPQDILTWTDGRALVATGSPFAPISYGKKSFEIAQCNNSYIFPGMGLGILAVGARRVSDKMFMAASRALSDCAPALKSQEGALLPELADIRVVSRHIALAVAAQAEADGAAEPRSDEERRSLVEAQMWTPQYRQIEAV
ncbi:MAG: NAD-dependent malic enzyme [Pseudomonadota bacterium]